MDNLQNLFDRVVSIQYQITESDRTPQNFGTDELLYQSEIHFIDVMGICGDVSVSDMKNRLGITNGAITQITDKLIRKGMIEKYKKEGNKKTIYFRTTKKGEVAYLGHMKFHKQLNDNVISYVKSLSKEQFEGIAGLIDVVEKSLAISHARKREQ